MSRIAFAPRQARTLAASIALVLGTAHIAVAGPLAELTGRAILPAASFAPGPTSGQFIGAGPINGQPVPFIDKQPIQGFSAVLKKSDGSYLAMADNGFGSLENSADFNLRVYKLRPNFKTATGGDGSIAVESYIELRDPDRKIPFTLANEFNRGRVLTGADFDIESIRAAKDGTLWFGDEFGPFLLHTDCTGKVLEAPIALPDPHNPGHDIRSPQNPFYEEASAVRLMNAARSHAKRYGNSKTPVFSPYHVQLKYAARTSPAHLVYPASDPNMHYARGTNTPARLTTAASDVFDVKSIQAAGYPVVTWTVNSADRMTELLKVGVNGIISDEPDTLYQAVKDFDANGDGTPGDFLDADGLINSAKFDAQGHRGGRNLRPENTLPAMEVALDSLMTTLETDVGISADWVPVLDHDPYIEAAKCRRADGQPYTLANQVLVKDLTVKQIQSTFVCDKLLSGRPRQTNDRTLSPVSVAFAAQHRWADAYVKPTVQQLFDFVAFYVDYYKTGAGKNDSNATLRWKNAEKVRFNLETKINPRSDTDTVQNRVYKERTRVVAAFGKQLAKVITANGLTDRADIQSFDFRTLLWVQKYYPAIRTVYLFGDFPIYPDQTNPDSDDGTNMQDENGANTPWMAGMYWPYRDTVQSTPIRAQRSGGFEGMALSLDRSKLYPLLELPLLPLPGGEASKVLKIFEFDLATKQYTGTSYEYALELNENGSFKGTNIGDFTMHGATRGLVIERDGGQGNSAKFKAIYSIQFGAPGNRVSKTLVADLMNIADPNGISLGGDAGDLGLGSTFSFPFVTIEDVVVLDSRHIGVLNDNNYPFSVGRHVGSGLADDNEFIILKLNQKLPRD